MRTQFYVSVAAAALMLPGAAFAQSTGSIDFEESGEGRYFIILEGVTRFRLAQELTVMTPYRQGAIAADEFLDQRIEHIRRQLIHRYRYHDSVPQPMLR